MIPVEEAISCILGQVRRLPAERVSLLGAVGRVLAEDLYAVGHLPPFDRSPLDGYALRAEDTRGASRGSPCRLRVLGEVAAGEVPHLVVEAGTAVGVATGAPLPPGADAVVALEETTPEPVGSEGWVQVGKELSPGENVSRAGEDVRRGELVLARGTVLGPAHVGLLAALGEEEVPVARRPEVAILSTGSELVEVGEEPGEWQIRNSSAYALAAAVARCGGVPRLLGVVPDSVEAIAGRLRAAAGADLILTTGGVSVGKSDLMPAVLGGLGAEVLFWRVAMKPGTPVLAARWGKGLVVALSGNPAAALTSFDVLVKPALGKMGGRSTAWPTVPAVLAEDYRKTSRLRRYLQARLEANGGGYRAHLLAGQRPGVLSSMARANGYVIIPEGAGPLRAGALVQALVRESP